MNFMGKLAVLVSLMLSVVWPASGQVPLTDLKLMGGPWECTSRTGIEGIFISVNTALTTRGNVPPADWQTTDVRVYHRSPGNAEEAQYFAPPRYQRFDQPREENYSTDLKDRHLIIHYGVDLDLRFDVDAKRWVGSWAERGEPQQVILERPHPPSSALQNPFVGDWESNPDPHDKPVPANGSLHIRESSDGRLTAWLDRELSGFNPRMQSAHAELWNGERLEILADQTKLTLATTNPFGAAHHYNGMLSSDGKNLAGEWQAQGNGRLSAPANFIRMQQSKIPMRGQQDFTNPFRFARHTSK